MKLKFSLIILFMLIGTSGVLAQTKNLDNVQVADHIAICLSKNYHPDFIALSKLCRRACIFIKFKVNVQGQITNLSFTKDLTIFITRALIRAIDSLQHDPFVMNALKRSGKTIIQPFIYDYQLGCNFPAIALTGTKEDGDQFLKSYYKIRDDMEHYGESLFDMLNFSDGRLSFVDCILLNPLRVGATSE